MDKTCKTCKWWIDKKDCSYIYQYSLHKEQNRINITFSFLDNKTHGIETFLETGPDFGCIHHE